MQHTPIGVFDSGIGGLSVANAISGLLPRESLCYVADNARAPYGPQSANDILAYSQEITKALLKKGAKLIVVACNTATSLAIDELRARHPQVPFVGLEPAVKPARKGAKIGVLATSATLASERYLTLKDSFLRDKLVLENPCKGLVPIIEQEASGSGLLRQKLEAILQPMLRQGIDTLVLGCTHYPMVREDIAAVCGPQVNIIDPSQAAARQVVRMLKKHGLERYSPQTDLLSAAAGQSIPTNTAPKSVHGTGVPAHNFFCTGSSVPLQRSLFNLPALNRHRRLVIPHYSL